MMEGYVPIFAERALRPCYRRYPKADELLTLIAGECDELPFTEVMAAPCDVLKPFDLVLVDNDGSGAPRHIMTVTGCDGLAGEERRVTVVHTHPQQNRVVEHSYSTEWQNLTHSVWRLKVLS
jgi:hypothetical protein